MNLYRLGLLRELQHRGSVTAVARALHVTPTAISLQLKTLEREAGAELVARVGRGVRLTDAGALLADASLKVAVAQEQLESAWESYRGTLTGQVRVSFFPTAGQLLLPGCLSRLAPHTELSLIASDLDVSGAQYPEHTNDFDIVVAHRATNDPEWSASGVVIFPLLQEPLDVCMAEDHPLASSHAPLDVTELFTEQWIGVPSGWPFDRLLTDWFATAGVEPNVVQRFEDMRLQEALISSGHGIGLLPRYALDRRLTPTIVSRPLKSFTASRTVAALVREDRAERVAVKTVLAAIRAEAELLTQRI